MFPTLLSYPAASIVPEGTDRIGTSWNEGCVGTGPFRVVQFDPGRRLEVERNPLYWRAGYPKSDGLVFRFGMSADEVRDEFMAGRLSIAAGLAPTDVEKLRHDPVLGAGYRELPRMCTYYAGFNCRRAPLDNLELRRRLVRDVDIPAIVQRHLGRLAIPAHGIIPPGLVGYTASRNLVPAAEPFSPGEEIELTAGVHPVFFEQYAGIARELTKVFAERGVRIKPITRTMKEFMEVRASGEVDLMIGRWYADYPDSDSFAHGMLHSQGGMLGNFSGSSEMDSLIESGREEGDPSIRHSIYREIEQVVARNALLLPLFHEQIYRIARPGARRADLESGFPGSGIRGAAAPSLTG